MPLSILGLGLARSLDSDDVDLRYRVLWTIYITGQHKLSIV